MNRRNFLSGLGALVGGLAIEQAIPLGRVWSFPSKIVRPKLTFDYLENYQRAINSVSGEFPIIWPIEVKTREELLKKYPMAHSGEVGTLYGFDTP